MRHLDVGDVDGLTPLVNTLGQLPLDDAQRLTLQNTIIARLHRADDYVIDRSIALLKNLDLTPQQTHQVGQILEPYLATAYTPLWQSASTAILQIQPDLQPGDALFKKIYASVFSRLDSPDGATRYAAGSVIHELITDEQRFNLVLQALLRRLDEPAGDPLYQVVAGVLDTANPYRLDAESQKRIMPVLNHPDQRLRQQAITILAKHLLLLNQAISDNAVADSLLKNLIEDPQARRHAGYRRALIQALAYWYNAGIAHSDARAVEEHENLQEQLQLLREKTLPWWLRTAATEVLTTAYQLRP
jgi:hypothetical protein